MMDCGFKTIKDNVATDAYVPYTDDNMNVAETDRFAGAFELDLSGVPLKMIKVKAGKFLMGSFKGEWGRWGDEKQHWVMLTKNYWLGETSVTQGQWKVVMGTNPSEFQKGHDFPVENVSWDEAMTFCNKLTQKYRRNMPSGYKFSLPTEAQWEYACRAGTTSALNSGKNLSHEYYECPNLDEVGWYEKNSLNSTHPVKKKKANAWGFYDMHGNVWEWCSDWHDWHYGCNDRNVTNPRGPFKGEYRVHRGGAWMYGLEDCRSATRLSCASSRRENYLGFRLALVPVQ